jgi:hypothetical protein
MAEKRKTAKGKQCLCNRKRELQKMLLYSEGITMEPEQILAIGMQELKKEQDEFNAAAKIIDPNKKPIDVYHDLQKIIQLQTV